MAAERGAEEARDARRREERRGLGGKAVDPQDRKTRNVLRGHGDQEEGQAEPDQRGRRPVRQDEHGRGDHRRRALRAAVGEKEQEKGRDRRRRHREDPAPAPDEKPDRDDREGFERDRGHRLDRREAEGKQDARQHRVGERQRNAGDRPADGLHEAGQHHERACQEKCADRRGKTAAGAPAPGAARRRASTRRRRSASSSATRRGCRRRPSRSTGP